MTKNKTQMMSIMLATLLLITVGVSRVPANAELSSSDASLPVKSVTFDNSVLKPGQVMTPFGPWDADKVVEIKDGTIFDADAVLEKYKKEHPNEDFPITKAKKQLEASRIQQQRSSNPPPATDGWNVWRSYTASSGLTSFSGNWIVPSTPVNSNYGSTKEAYLFIGIEDVSPTTTIIQPVLQYGCTPAFCGNEWRIASWIVAGPIVGHSTAKSTAVGHHITGTMSRLSNQWSITTIDTDNSNQTILSTTSSLAFRYATVTLETYGLAAVCNDLPGNTSFTSLSINSGSITPTWLANTGNTWCNMSSASGSSTLVTLHTLS